MVVFKGFKTKLFGLLLGLGLVASTGASGMMLEIQVPFSIADYATAKIVTRVGLNPLIAGCKAVPSALAYLFWEAKNFLGKKFSSAPKVTDQKNQEKKTEEVTTVKPMPTQAPAVSTLTKVADQTAQKEKPATVAISTVSQPTQEKTPSKTTDQTKLPAPLLTRKAVLTFLAQGVLTGMFCMLVVEPTLSTLVTNSTLRFVAHLGAESCVSSAVKAVWNGTSLVANKAWGWLFAKKKLTEKVANVPAKIISQHLPGQGG